MHRETYESPNSEAIEPNFPKSCMKRERGGRRGDSHRVSATAWILLATDYLTDQGMGLGSTCLWSVHWFEWVSRTVDMKLPLILAVLSFPFSLFFFILIPHPLSPDDYTHLCPVSALILLLPLSSIKCNSQCNSVMLSP